MYRRLNFAIATLALILVPTITSAAIPQKLNFQAILLDSLDHVVPDGEYDLTFRLVTDSIGGTVLWEETQHLQTDNGLFNTFLGLSTPVPDAAFDGVNPWLEIQLVDNAFAYEPRTQMGSVAFSYRSGTVDGATGGTISGNLTVAGSQQTVQLHLDTDGNESVGLPDDAVAAPEILDEPGIAQGMRAHDAEVTGLLSMHAIVSCTLDIPAPGYIMVQAMAQARFRADHNDEGQHDPNYFDYAIVEGGETEADEAHTYRAGFGRSWDDYNTWWPISAQRTYRKMEAGHYVFELIAVDACHSGHKSLWNPIITAVYYPSAYGPVMTCVPGGEGSNYGTASVEAVVGDNENTPGPSGTVTTVDLRDALPTTVNGTTTQGQASPDSAVGPKR